MDDSNEELDEYTLGTKMSVVTIVLDSEKEAPEVFLDDVSPIVALALFRSIVETLEQCLPTPTINYKNEIIASEFYSDDDYLDDDADQ